MLYSVQLCIVIQWCTFMYSFKKLYSFIKFYSFIQVYRFTQAYSSVQYTTDINERITRTADTNFVFQVKCTIFWLKRVLKVHLDLDLYAPDVSKITSEYFFRMKCF